MLHVTKEPQIDEHQELPEREWEPDLWEGLDTDKEENDRTIP